MENEWEKALEMKERSWTKEDVLSNVIFHLTEKARYPQGVPGRDFLDLRIQYDLEIMDEATEKYCTRVVTNDMMKHVCVTEQELYDAAYHNTSRNGYEIKDMHDVSLEAGKPRWRFMPQDGFHVFWKREKVCGKSVEFTFPNGIMYVLQSKEGRPLGSSILLHPCYIGTLAKMLDTDLYIIPCSMHDILATPAYLSPPVSAIRQTVYETNRNAEAVHPIDKLSDSVYFYNLAKKELVVASE